MEERRTRTVTWTDPMTGARAARGMSGIEYLNAIVRGEMPAAPIALVLGFAPLEVGEGTATFAVEPGEHQYNPIGVVHGGLLATVLDSALGCAVHSRLPAGVAYTTTDLNVHFVRAVTRETGRLLCRARVRHLGGRVATAEGEITDEQGRLYAHGSSTCLVIRPEAAPAGQQLASGS